MKNAWAAVGWCYVNTDLHTADNIALRHISRIRQTPGKEANLADMFTPPTASPFFKGQGNRTELLRLEG